MRLVEVAAGEKLSRIIMLRDGYYLKRGNHIDSFTNWSIYRLLDGEDAPVGEALTSSASETFDNFLSATFYNGRTVQTLDPGDTGTDDALKKFILKNFTLLQTPESL